MLELKGKNAEAKVFTDNVEPQAISQIIEALNQPFSKGQRVRIMPDCHAGKGCTIGFTATVGDKVVPNLVGVDIGCGMLTAQINEKVDLEKLDAVIRKYVPSGFSIRQRTHNKADEFKKRIEKEGLFANIPDMMRALRSIGTLGGGNHFIELGVGEDGGHYLVIHSGSRSFGKEIADFHQKKAIQNLSLKEREMKIIQELKKAGKENEIEKAIQDFKKENPVPPKDLAYLEGDELNEYLHDTHLAQEYASLNRRVMLEEIAKNMGWVLDETQIFETIHNYIDMDAKILRKGAISAKEGEIVLIPINMRDGSLVCRGKGNPDWNYSAPHGAGRLLSRSAAKENLSMDKFRDEMKGIYSTSISESTLDESPMAYKPMEEIINNIGDTVEIINRIKPIYNFKA